MADQPLVVTKSIESAIRLLNAAGCHYKVISPNGDQYGGLEVVTRKKKQINPNRNYGELRKYYDMFMKYDASVGDVIEIPSGKYPPEDIRGGICAKLTTIWGKGTYVSAIVEDKVQILRTA
jgi:hypothetical protein